MPSRASICADLSSFSFIFLHPMKSTVLPLVLATLSMTSPLFAQAAAGSSAAPLVAKSGPPRHAQELAGYELPLAWDDVGGDRVRSLAIKNDGKAALQIYGAQATSGIFVVDYPTAVAPGRSESLGFIYIAPSNTVNELEVVRLLTSEGIKELSITATREQAAVVSKRVLQWTAGEEAAAQSVTVDLPGSRTALRAARSLRGITTRIEFPSAGSARVWVQPASTNTPGSFPIWLDFEPALPGGPVVLTGEIVSAKR